MLLNCDGEDSWESLDCKEIMPINPKGNESWIFIGRTDAEPPILWPPDVKSWLIRKNPDAWEKLKAGGEGDDRRWDGWMTSPTQWTWVWVNSGSWWWTGKPGVLQSMGSQKVGRDCELRYYSKSWEYSTIKKHEVPHHSCSIFLGEKKTTKRYTHKKINM